MPDDLRAEVDRRVGRNLLRYQLVEIRLKAVLPFRQTTFSTEGLDTLQETIETFKRLSLGQLLPVYRDAFDGFGPGEKERFAGAIDEFLNARNRLVHHLLQDNGLLVTPAVCEACIAQLDEDYRRAEDIARQVLDFYRFVMDSIQTFLAAWAEATPGPSGMKELSRRHADLLAERNRTDIEVELQIPLSEAVGEILATLERTQMREDGWTLFAHVAPEFKQTYQVYPRRVLAFARQIPTYEFAERSTRPGAGTAWMFRRRAGAAAVTTL